MNAILLEKPEHFTRTQIPEPPAHMLGWVTSSYASQSVDRSIALALVERGRERLGSTIYAELDGETAPVTITEPVFFDPEGARRDG